MNRRTLLTALTGAALAPSAVAAFAAPETDMPIEMPDWWRKKTTGLNGEILDPIDDDPVIPLVSTWKRMFHHLNDPGTGEIEDEAYEVWRGIGAQICETQATSAAGVRAQLEYAVLDDVLLTDGTRRERALVGNMLKSLAALS